MSSHLTIYKIIFGDSGEMKMKAMIATHANDESIKKNLRSDWSQCASARFRLILSWTTSYKWRISNLDVNCALLKAGQVERDFFVHSISDSPQKISSSAFSIITLMHLSTWMKNGNSNQIGFFLTLGCCVPLSFRTCSTKYQRKNHCTLCKNCRWTLLWRKTVICRQNYFQIQYQVYFWNYGLCIRPSTIVRSKTLPERKLQCKPRCWWKSQRPRTSPYPSYA